MSRPTGPVFVCGAERSGTSLMFALLASHSRLSMVRRSNMWRWFHQKFGDLSETENLDRAIETLSRYKRLEQLEPDWDRIRSELLAHPPVTYGRLFDLMHRHRADRVGRPRWGDKSLHTEYHARALFREFPEARVIHLVRDPRDRHASIAGRYEDRSKGIASSTGRWLSSVKAASANQRRFGDRYLVVRFEDLAAEPVSVMTRVCEFLGEDFEPDMMLMQGAPEHSQGNSSFEELAPNSISTKPIGRFRTRLPAADIAFIQLAAGREMRRLGYSPEPVDLGGRDRVGFALRSVVDLARVRAWTIQDRLGRSRETAPSHRLVEAAT